MSALDFIARGLVRKLDSDLASNGPGKGAHLIGASGGGSVQDRLDGYDDRSGLKALEPSNGDCALLKEAGRGGLFVFDASDLSSEVALDTEQGITIAPDSDPSGSSGAWVRQYVGVADPEWFGFTDGTALATAAQNAAALQTILDRDIGYGYERVMHLPLGQFFTNALTLGATDGIHSFTLRGDAPVFGSQLKLDGAGAYMLEIGNGDYDSFDNTIQDIALYAQNLVTEAAVFFNRGNFLRLSNVVISEFVGEKGLYFSGGDQAEGRLMQVVSLSDVQLFGNSDGSGTRGAIGLDIESTGDFDVRNITVETCNVAIRAYGDDSFGMLNISGGHIERTDVFALELQDHTGRISLNAASGAVWLGNGVVGADILISNNGGGNFSGNPSGICDNGFGNRIGRVGATHISSGDYAKSAGTHGHWQDGFEWMRVPGYNPHPVFSGSDDYAVASNCTMYEIPSPLPHAPVGAGALALVATANGGYVEFGPFNVTTAKDYLGLVGLLINKNNHDEITIGLYDTANTLLASKTIRAMSANADNSPNDQFRFEKVLACDLSGTTIKLRITIATSGVRTECWFADIKQSENLHTTQIVNSTSTSGSGSQKKYRRQLDGTNMALQGLAAQPYGTSSISRMLLDIVTNNSGDSMIGEAGTGNTPTQRQKFRLPDETGEREWTWLAPHGVKGVGGTRISCWNFSGTGDVVDLYESSVHRVYPETRVTAHRAVISGSALAAEQRVPLWLPVKGQRGLILGARYGREMVTGNVGDATNYWTASLQKRLGGGAATTMWSVNNQSATWSTLTPTDIARSVFEAIAVPLILEDSDKLFIQLAKTNAPPAFDGALVVTVLVLDFLPAGT